ncbi:MAG: protein-export chaperone SecB [Alphaproteobacteria bacterium]|nr:protein-export chaperone SecB [Alphaproteobacteria bacterium]
MTDTTNAARPDHPPAQGQPPVAIHAQYIRDLSFEVPGAPEIFRQSGEGQEIPIGIEVQTRHLEGQSYEVVLHMRIEAKAQGNQMFILEIAYGAVCTINVPEQHLQPVLLVEVPRLLFPFVRSMVADLTRDGGFPPLLVTPIDFGELYRQRLAQMAQQAQEGAEAAAAPPGTVVN